MKTRKEMLAHPRTSANYKLLNTINTPAMICRGTTKSDYEFFYSELPLWSDHCAGWIRSSKTELNCLSCELAKAKDSKTVKSRTKNEIINREPGDSNSAPRSSSKSSKPRSSKVPGLHNSKKHSRKSDTCNAGTKKKKNNKTLEIRKKSKR